MKSRTLIIITTSVIFVIWIGVINPSVCILTDGPAPDWLGSHGGCGPYVTYEIQKYFGILWYN